MGNGQKTSALLRRLDRANSELSSSYERLEEFIKVRVQGEAKQKILDWLRAEKNFHFDIDAEFYLSDEYRSRIVELFEDIHHYLYLDSELNSKVGYHLSVVKYYNDIIELISGDLLDDELDV